ncbi:crossover junction endodeoxyribonuclease RuvC [Candidatus Haliotispira prima]|uniref:Crossover junction endodeoxyribonuclease RuvC n=1 Tax=Candidatus Haliotispira prima TaxID=3034016 RepID=A0ABY8MIQ9_9SPIO|nr:crossover junction endodeoxyribonuclease RuvC [Candidatus Haliotispira prima]
MTDFCVIGLDPGLAHLGWGVISLGRVPVPGAVQPALNSGGRAIRSSALRMLDCGEIQTSNSLSPEQRLQKIYMELAQIFSRYRPLACSVEELYLNKNSSSALPVAQARGVALLCAAQQGAPVAEFSANRIKQSVTGNGKAQKLQVQEMVAFLLGFKAEFSGGLGPDQAKPVLRSDHAADALAAAICLVHERGAEALLHSWEIEPGAETVGQESLPAEIRDREETGMSGGQKHGQKIGKGGRAQTQAQAQAQGGSQGFNRLVAQALAVQQRNGAGGPKSSGK